MLLNERAHRLAEEFVERADLLSAHVERSEAGCRLIDCADGGLEAGRRLAELCLSGLGEVRYVPGRADVWQGPAVQVRTDHPVAACMASQYAGWKLAHHRFFAMGSGPMRAAAGHEDLFADIGHRERPMAAVGVLETRDAPPPEICQEILTRTGVSAGALSLFYAPTVSLPGTVQIVARSVETALHKLHELGFDLAGVKAGYGIAPLPPPARDDLAGIGRTNDAILYGGEVTLWLTAEDEALAELAPRVPSNASDDHGEPFAALFQRYDGDFYKIDPLLFSPAVIHLVNLTSGRTFTAGTLLPEIVQQSFSS